MYSVSNAYKTAIRAINPDSYVLGTITLLDSTIITITDADINSLDYISQCTPDDGFSVGYTHTGEQGITIYDDMTNYRTFQGAKIELIYYLKISPTEYEGVPLGIFEVVEATRPTATTIKLVGYDNMTKFDVDYPLNDETTEKTPFQRLKDICVALGVELWDDDVNVQGFLNLMPNGTAPHTLAFSPEIVTARDYLDYLCQLLCGFATIDRLGRLRIVCWRLKGTITGYAIPDTLRKKSEFNDTVLKYSAVNMSVSFTGADDVFVKNVIAPEVPTGAGEVLSMYTNALIRGTLYNNAQTVLDNIASVMTNTDPSNGTVMQWVPCDIQYTGDPALDLGDWVTYTGYTAGDGIEVPIHKIDWKYRGWQRLETLDMNRQAERENNANRAKQAEQAQQMIALKTVVEDNLISTSTEHALSANMGRELDKRVTEVADAIPDEIFEERLLEILYPAGDWALDENTPLPYEFRNAYTLAGTSDGLHIVYVQKVYKFNRDLKTFTQKADLPSSTSGSTVIGDGNYIYFFGGNSSATFTLSYKYNVLTGTTEILPNTPTRFNGATGAKIGRHVYFINPNGSNAGAEKKHMYRFNLDTYVYERLTDTLVEFGANYATSLGNEIYISYSTKAEDGVTNLYNQFCKFNADSGVWTNLPGFVDAPASYYEIFAYDGKIHGVPLGSNTYPGFTFDPIKLTFEDAFIYPVGGNTNFEACCVLGGVVYFKMDLPSSSNFLVQYDFGTELSNNRYIGETSVKELWEQVLDVTGDIYSTTETKTNQKWLDGKPIYRKLFEIPNASLTAGTTQIALDVLNVETITSLHATIGYTASTSLINVNSYWCSDLVPTVSSQIIKIECTDGSLEIDKQNDMSVDYENLTITVEFTKTS